MKHEYRDLDVFNDISLRAEHSSKIQLSELHKTFDIASGNQSTGELRPSSDAVHEPNGMQMMADKGFFSFAFNLTNLAHQCEVRRLNLALIKRYCTAYTGQ